MGKRIRIKCVIISIVFAVIIAAGVCMAFTFGDKLLLSAFAHGSGTESDPYRIYNADQFLSLQEVSSSRYAEEYTKDKYFVLCNDITVITSAQQTEFGFFGHLNGNGHTLNLQDGSMFYNLRQYASISDLNVKLDLKWRTGKYKYGIAKTVFSHAVIENCTITGNIDIDLTKLHRYPWNGARYYCAPVCIANNGHIKNCTYNGNIVCNAPSSLAYRYISGISILGNGIIEDCAVNCEMFLIANGFIEIISGLSTENRVKNSSYTGDITVTKVDESKYKFSGVRTVIYGLGCTVQNCSFDGDIVFYKTYKPRTYMIAKEGSTYVFNGVMKRVSSDDTEETLLESHQT